MNNAFLIEDTLKEEPKVPQPEVLKRIGEVTDIIEAIQHIGGSSHWAILYKVFEVDLAKAKRRLATEKDTTEMFRLQGELRWEDKINLEKMLSKYRDELQALRQRINE